MGVGRKELSPPPPKGQRQKVGKDSRIAANHTRIQEAGSFLSGGLEGSEGGICKFDTSPDTWHQCGPEAPTALCLLAGLDPYLGLSSYSNIASLIPAQPDILTHQGSNEWHLCTGTSYWFETVQLYTGSELIKPP